MLLIGSIITILTTLGCAISQTITQLLLFRLLQGMMVGMMSTPGYATINESYDSNETIKKIVLLKGIFILAPALGPLFGSLILTPASWRWIFGIMVIWITLSNIGLFFTMPETLSEKNREPLHLRKTLTRYK